MGVSPDSVYILDSAGALRAVSRGIGRGFHVRDIMNNPRLPFVALLGTVPTQASQGEGWRKKSANITVLDANQNVVVRFEGGLLGCWSPSGRLLAIAIGRLNADGPATPESVVVWDLQAGEQRRYKADAQCMGWIGEDTLRVQTSRSAAIIDLIAGTVMPADFMGAISSPSRRYSLSIIPERDFVVWDELDRREVTPDILRLLGEEKPTTYPAPFWAGAKDGKDLLCLPSCRMGSGTDEAAPSRSGACATHVIELPGLRPVNRIPGVFLERSRGESRIVQSNGGKVGLHNLRKETP
jgi:hypothetical protein